MPAYWAAAPAMCDNWDMDHHGGAPHGPISVFLADDNLIVREGVRALINARKTCRWSGWPPTSTSW